MPFTKSFSVKLTAFAKPYSLLSYGPGYSKHKVFHFPQHVSRQLILPFLRKVSFNSFNPSLTSSHGYTTCSLRVVRKVTSPLPLRNEPFFVTGSRLVGTPQDPSAPLNQFACLEVNTRRLFTPTTSPESTLLSSAAL